MTEEYHGSMRKNSVYSVHPGFAMEEASLRLLKERTNRTVEEWVRIVKKSGAATERERIAWLKAEHGITTNYALWIAKRVDGGGTAEDYDPDAMVEAMFAGKKAGLLPIYERILEIAFALGKDVRVSPGKTIVPFYRKHVFAQAKPTTNTRIDLGFAFRDMKPAGRLISTGGFEKGDRITHRIPLGSVAEIDKEVKKWLTLAYEKDV
jgi:Domain of unknown function (DUF5655)/Domain of unknown function (DUF4287)